MLSSDNRKKMFSKFMNEYNTVRHILAIESNAGNRNFFLDKNTYSLGRSATNTIVLYHRVVSRNHATLLKVTYQGLAGNNSIFWIIDGDLKGNRSTNGIYINGNRCLSHQLQPGDVILLGGVEVRAKYDIVDLNSRNFYSVTKGNYLQVDKEEKGDVEEDKPTSITTRELNKEPLIEEFTKVIDNIKDPTNYYYLVINSQGKIREISELLQQTITDIDILKLGHPLLRDLKFELPENHHKLLVRNFDIDNKNFTQYIYYSEKSDLITTYLLTRNQKQQLEIKLRENEERYYNIIKQISEGIFFVDIETQQIVEVNQAYCQLIGYLEAEILQLKLEEIFAIDQEILANDLKFIIANKTTLVRESTQKRKDNSIINVEISVSVVIYLGKEALCFCVRDITERKKVEELLRYQTAHDSVTNLPNQKLFKEQLLATITNNKKEQKRFSLILIKFNEMTKIRYALGNDINNELLQLLAKLIKAGLSIGDGLARWADDEFIILLPEVNSEDDIKNVIEKILEKFKNPLIINNSSFHLTTSIGIVVYPDHGKNELKLMRNLNVALAESRNFSGNNYRFYHDDLQISFRTKFDLDTALYKVINKAEFYLEYQPRLNLNNNNISSLHSYLKCESDQQEIKRLSNSEILVSSEEMGLGEFVFYWQLENICQHYQQWQKANIDLPTISLKACLSNFQSSDFVDQTISITDKYQVNLSQIELEIINVNPQSNLSTARNNLIQLSQQGVRICLSNFDLENFVNLEQSELSINSIKISEELSSNLHENNYSNFLVKSIIELANFLSVGVYAENVNDQEILDILSSLNCTEMVGKVFTQPLLADQVVQFLGRSTQVES